MRKGVGAGGGGDDDDDDEFVGLPTRGSGRRGNKSRLGIGIVESFGLLRNAIATFSSAMTTTTIYTKTFNSPSPGIYQLDLFSKHKPSKSTK